MKIVEAASRMLGTLAGRPRLIYAHYGVTHRCNMRCRMCSVWKTANRAAELSLPQVEQLADLLSRAGVRTIALGGGEPFVREDIAGIVRLFAGREMDVRLLTNGIGVSDQKIDSVISAGIKHVSISLDSADPEKEKYIYSDRDVWKEITDTMRRFRARLEDPASMPVMNVCVSRLNMEELPGLVSLAEGLGFFCSFVPVCLLSSEKEDDGFAAYAPELAIQPADHDKVKTAYRELLRLKRQGRAIANSSRFLRDSLEYLLIGKSAWKCDAGLLYLSVSPEGDISICHHFPPFARFDTPDLAQKLAEKEVQELNSSLRDACPGCMRPCWGEVTNAMHHLPSAWEAMRSLGVSARLSSKAKS